MTELNLEEITNSLLNGDIDIEESKQLCKSLCDRIKQQKQIEKEKNPQKNKQKENKIYTIIEPGVVNAFNSDYHEMGILTYYEFNDQRNERVLIIENVLSYKKNSGVFREMFNTIKKYSKRNKIRYLLLEVHNENQTAIDIYKHYNFQLTNSPLTIPSIDNSTSWMTLSLENRL